MFVITFWRGDLLSGIFANDPEVIAASADYPTQCSFTAPDGQEFVYWLVSSSQGTIGTLSLGDHIDIASSGNLTVTA